LHPIQFRCRSHAEHACAARVRVASAPSTAKTIIILFM
jgi:hypothetical protein